MNEMIKMKVTGLTIDPFTNMPIIILKDATEAMALPIWIGLIEASSIATELEKIELSRPMTHDLMKHMLHEMGVTVGKVEITDLTNNTFFAKIWLNKDGKNIPMDCRPSDAIALALRMKSDIFVAKEVMEKSRRIDLTQESAQGKMKEQKWAEILENLSPEDFGKYKM
jgi:bifunctional DNase/RNase